MRGLKFITGFLLLNVYLRVVPTLLIGNDVLWLAAFILFFPLAHFVGRWSSGAGLRKQGLAQTFNWKKRLLTGALTGSAIWLVLTSAELLSGSLQFAGWQPLGKASWIAVQALVVAVLGSATNDVLTRGYVFAHWKGRLPVLYIVLLSTALYLADDVWLEGWSARNNTFSLVLGLAFALSVVRTGSLWMNTGTHAGLNFIYYLVYGFGNGKYNDGVFISTSHPAEASPYLGVFAALGVLGLTALMTKSYRGREERQHSSAVARRVGPEELTTN